MTRIAPLVLVLVTSSLLLSWTEASILCTWTKVSPNAELHYSFLRRDPREPAPSLRLYHSSWSRQRALLGCAWSDDAAVIHNYLSLCRERTREFSDDPDESFLLDSMFEGEEPCVSLASPRVAGRAERTARRPVRSVPGQGHGERSEVRISKRVKRGFIIPGTLWCGSGNKAPSYADLGVFSDTDSCCREHDQCKHTILSFHSQFGVFNSNMFTLSHCDCDNKFRTCLKEANDTIADVVGYTFFNLLKAQCFQFSHRLQCTQRNWFGMCKETKMALYADVHPPRLYESTDGFINGSIINSTSELLESVTSGPLISSDTDPAASTVPTPSSSSPSTSVAPGNHIKTSTVEKTSGPSPERRDHLENSLFTNNQTGTEQDLTETSCGVFKDIDECRDKILPHQRKYGLRNTETRTLYHCNCTSRLFRTLAGQRQLTEVQGLLLGHVSSSCFVPPDCDTCTAVLLRAEPPRSDHRSGAGGAEERRRHLQAVELKVRRPNSNRAKRKDRVVRLHRLCVRISRLRRTNKSRKYTHTHTHSQRAVRGRQLV